MLRGVALLLGTVVAALVFESCLESSELPFEKQLEKDQAIIDQYLADKGITPQVEPGSGLRYVVHDFGTGQQPVLANNPCVNFGYEGRYLNDEVIFAPRDTASAPLQGLIYGFWVGLPQISEGGSITMYIPSGYAYGSNPRSPIRKNANMIFDVDLIAIGAYNSQTGTCQ